MDLTRRTLLTTGAAAAAIPHPYVIAMESALLAPKSEVGMYPWKDTKDKIPLAVRQLRTFLRAHRPVAA